MMSSGLRAFTALLGSLAVVASAQQGAAAQTAARGERSGKEVAEAVCAACHAAGAGGAPRIGESRDWSGRLSHGLDSAVTKAIRGHGGMPARGGKAELTDNEVKSAIIYMFNPGGAPAPQGAGAAAGAAPMKPAGNVKTVGGTDIYLGVLPAEAIRSLSKDSAERSMHGGVPGGAGQYHVNVSVIDAATRAPIAGARAQITIDEPGISSETKALQPVTLGSAPSYGSYVKLKAKTQYVFIVKVQKPDSAQPIEARFEHRVY